MSNLTHKCICGKNYTDEACEACIIPNRIPYHVEICKVCNRLCGSLNHDHTEVCDECGKIRETEPQKTETLTVD